MVLLDNREVKKGWQTLKDTVSGMFKKHGAAVLSAKRWDERRLMYQVGRCRRATYLLVYFEGESVQTNSIRRELELNEQVLRHMMLTCEAVPQTAYDAEAAFDESALAIEDTPAPEPMPVEAGDGGAGRDRGRDRDRDKDKDKDGEKGEVKAADAAAEPEAAPAAEGDKPATSGGEKS